MFLSGMRNKSVSCHESKAFDIKAYAWDSHLKAKYETWQVKQNIKYDLNTHNMALAYLMDGIQTVLFVKKVLQNLNSHKPITY